ncbi:hypothetical protein TorRG33x02_295470 [Trema orientale]|uniref:Uncharacterized protein n=1 Tax=Trema orientale TaxID=63057 RepID=A0A2P5C6S7_TREOI|nr:hypothetical protein TorRG33x02_295470 [Trema orientale]
MSINSFPYQVLGDRVGKIASLKGSSPESPNVGNAACEGTNDAQAGTATLHRTNPSKVSMKYLKSHLSASQTNHSHPDGRDKHLQRNGSNRIECAELMSLQSSQAQTSPSPANWVDRKQGGETKSRTQLRRHGEDRNVLKIWIIIKAVAGNMMGIMSPFPPSNADPSKAIPSQNLSKFVTSRAYHDLVMPRIMTHISAQNP